MLTATQNRTIVQKTRRALSAKGVTGKAADRAVIQAVFAANAEARPDRLEATLRHTLRAVPQAQREAFVQRVLSARAK